MLSNKVYGRSTGFGFEQIFRTTLRDPGNNKLKQFYLTSENCTMSALESTYWHTICRLSCPSTLSSLTKMVVEPMDAME